MEGDKKDDKLYTALRFYFAADDPETGEPQGILLPPFGVYNLLGDFERYDRDESVRKQLHDWVKGADNHIKAVIDKPGKWSEYGEDPKKNTSRYTDVVIGDRQPDGQDYNVRVIKRHKGTHKGASVLGLDDPDYVRYTWDELGECDADTQLFDSAMNKVKGKLGHKYGDEMPNVILQGDAANRYRQWMKGENGDKGKARYGDLSYSAASVASMLTDWDVPMTEVPERLQLYSVKIRPDDMYTSKDIADQKVTDWRDMVEEMTVKRLMPSKQLELGLVEDWMKGYLTKDRPDYDKFNRLFGSQLRFNDNKAPWSRREYITQRGTPVQDVDARYAWLFNRMFQEDPGHVVSDSTMKHIKKCLMDERTWHNVAGALSGLKY